jgi:hypothetical protein
LTIFFFLSGISSLTYSQVTLSASATATIVNPIDMSKVDDLNFGNLAVTTTPGTVTLDPSGARTITGGVTLPSNSGTVTPAEFIVTGVPLYTYSITLPSSAILVNTVGSGGETLLVDTFTSNPEPTGQLGPNGSQTLNVGATVHLSAYQVYGVYVSVPSFNVTVNYN